MSMACMPCVFLSVWLAFTIAPSDAQLSRGSLRRSQRDAGALLQQDVSGRSTRLGSQLTVLASEKQLRASRPNSSRGGDQEERGSPLDYGKAAFWGHWGGVAIVSTIFAGAFAWVAFKLVQLFIASRPAVSGFRSKGFKEYLVYSFEVWFEQTDNAVVIVVVVFTVSTFILGACAYTIGMGTNLFTSLWKVFAWLVAPDAGVAETRYYGMAIGSVMSVFGLIVFALILMVLQDGFVSFMKRQTEGASPVVETGHTLLLGFNDDTVMLLRELCKAHADSNGTTIVVLSSTFSKPDMEQRIRGADIELLGSRIVVRCNQAERVEHVRHVAAHTAATIILLPCKEDSDELRDAVMLQSLIMLRNKGYPHDGRIIVQCSLPRNVGLFQDIGGQMTDVVVPGTFMSKLIVQCSGQVGLGRVWHEMLGFEGSEFYVSSTPAHLVGRTFSDAALYYPEAVLAGVLEQDRRIHSSTRSLSWEQISCGHTGHNKAHRTMARRCTFCPGSDYELLAEDELVLLATDSSTAMAANVALTKVSLPESKVSGQSSTISPRKQAEGGETIVIVGWNHLAGNILLELDKRVAPDSEVLILAPQPPTEREASIQETQLRHNWEIQNITNIKHIKGEVGSRFAIEGLSTPIEDASRIFLLANENGGDPGKADAGTFIAFLQIRELLAIRSAKTRVTIITQVQKPSTELLCSDASIPDFVNTGTLPAQILAMVAYNPEIMAVINELITDEGRVHIRTYPLSVYLPAQSARVVPKSISFVALSRIVDRHGDVAIGWSKPCSDHARRAFHRRMSSLALEAGFETRVNQYELNPPNKTVEREWSMDDDMVVVLRSDKDRGDGKGSP